ncbi:MAG TPA: hypothetical protein VNE21_02455, partial [Mycobacteriales bacterium]|nr:hypothetical protein [Mycobacteriales bacterium]
YRYPHDLPAGVAAQQYAPDALSGRDYYRPSGRGAERVLVERVAQLRAIVRAATAELDGQPAATPRPTATTLPTERHHQD